MELYIIYFFKACRSRPQQQKVALKLFLTFKIPKLPILSLIRIVNEDELLLHIANGDQKAFAHIFHAYHDGLFQFVYTVSGDRQFSREVISDVFTRVWLSKDTLPSLASFVDWLFIVTRNQLIKGLRKRNAERVKVVHLNDHPRQYTDDKAQEHEYDSIMLEAVAQLPPKQQQAFRLSRLEGFDNKTIAKMMGITPGSVKKYLQWAQLSIMRFVRSKTGIITFFTLLQ